MFQWRYCATRPPDPPAGLVLYLGAWAYRIVTRKYYVWLPGYLSWLFHQEKPAAAPVHIFFFFVDHFEPGEDATIDAAMGQRISQDGRPPSR